MTITKELFDKYAIDGYPIFNKVLNEQTFEKAINEALEKQRKKCADVYWKRSYTKKELYYEILNAE